MNTAGSGSAKRHGRVLGKTKCRENDLKTMTQEHTAKPQQKQRRPKVLFDVSPWGTPEGAPPFEVLPKVPPMGYPHGVSPWDTAKRQLPADFPPKVPPPSTHADRFSRPPFGGYPLLLISVGIVVVMFIWNFEIKLRISESVESIPISPIIIIALYSDKKGASLPLCRLRAFGIGPFVPTAAVPL